MTDPNKNQDVIQHLYVDEAGDPNLFARRGEIILGQDGVIHCVDLELWAKDWLEFTTWYE